MPWQDDMQAVSAAIAQQGPQGQQAQMAPRPQPPPVTEQTLRRLLEQRKITPAQYQQAVQQLAGRGGLPPGGPPPGAMPPGPPPQGPPPGAMPPGPMLPPRR